MRPRPVRHICPLRGVFKCATEPRATADQPWRSFVNQMRCGSGCGSGAAEKDGRFQIGLVMKAGGTLKSGVATDATPGAKAVAGAELMATAEAATAAVDGAIVGAKANDGARAIGPPVSGLPWRLIFWSR